MRVVYVSHPIGGDVENNIERLKDVIYGVNMNNHDVVPFAPYISDVLSMNDANPSHRKKGLKNALFCVKFADEMWLFGDRISEGMSLEIEEANRNGIKIVPQTNATKRCLKKMVEEGTLKQSVLLNQ